jgi:acyl-CoA reductase-like NAD-dependent aldehyde dehydrogenase
MTQTAGSGIQSRDTLFIGGSWVAPDGADTLEVTNAATGEVVATIPAGTPVDADRAVRAARDAFAGWSQLAAEERAGYLERIQAGLAARAEDLTRIIATELGMPTRWIPFLQLGTPPFAFGYYAGLARKQEPETIAGNSLLLREPVGVVAAITPWNYPLHQIALKVAPALAAGCTVVLKPSEVTPLNAFVLAEVVAAAGLPAGVFNLVTGVGPVVGEALAAHGEVDMVSFTGSTRAGKRVAELAAQGVRRVALELGGKSANVILEGADLEKAVAAGVLDVLRNSGQSCDALSRMLVPRARLAEVEEIAARTAEQARIGDPFDPGTTLGPLVSSTQLERVRGYIRKGVEEGARLVTGGEEAPEGVGGGYYVRPTIFSDVRSDMTIAQEEIFGPVVSIIPYDSEEEAVSIANDTVYGLSGAVWAGDVEHAKAVAARMRTGRVYLNGAGFNVFAPFGGYKQSGIGRELGTFGLEEYQEVKAVQL